MHIVKYLNLITAVITRYLQSYIFTFANPCRCRHGYFHIVNNDYTHWEMYAIGGSANPTINSQGNRFLAPTNPFAKEVILKIENLLNIYL
jgi:pectate lyase